MREQIGIRVSGSDGRIGKSGLMPLHTSFWEMETWACMGIMVDCWLAFPKLDCRKRNSRILTRNFLNSVTTCLLSSASYLADFFVMNGMVKRIP